MDNLAKTSCKNALFVLDLAYGDLVGCDLELLRHGGMTSYGRLKDGTLAGGCGRQKRLRTSFKHHQLRSMKAYFALNHNPDAKDLKELAQKTGLTKRVLQVCISIGIYKCMCFIISQRLLFVKCRSITSVSVLFHG
jgi:Homeodomain